MERHGFSRRGKGCAKIIEEFEYKNSELTVHTGMRRGRVRSYNDLLLETGVAQKESCHIFYQLELFFRVGDLNSIYN